MRKQTYDIKDDGDVGVSEHKIWEVKLWRSFQASIKTSQRTIWLYHVSWRCYKQGYNANSRNLWGIRVLHIKHRLRGIWFRRLTSLKDSVENPGARWVVSFLQEGVSAGRSRYSSLVTFPCCEKHNDDSFLAHRNLRFWHFGAHVGVWDLKGVVRCENTLDPTRAPWMFRGDVGKVNTSALGCFLRYWLGLRVTFLFL